MIVLFYTIKQANLQKFAEHLGDISPLWAVGRDGFGLYKLCLRCRRSSKTARGNRPAALFFFLFQNFAPILNTLNYLMSVAGLSGVAAKVYLLSREDIPPSNTLSVSIIHGFLTNTIAVLFIYLGFFYLYSQHQITDRDQEVFGVMVLLVAFLMTWVTIQTIVHEAFRKKVWQIGLRAVIAFCAKIGRPHWIRRERAEVFFENFNDSLNMIMRNRSDTAVPGIPGPSRLGIYVPLPEVFVHRDKLPGEQ